MNQYKLHLYSKICFALIAMVLMIHCGNNSVKTERPILTDASDYIVEIQSTSNKKSLGFVIEFNQYKNRQYNPPFYLLITTADIDDNNSTAVQIILTNTNISETIQSVPFEQLQKAYVWNGSFGMISRGAKQISLLMIPLQSKPTGFKVFKSNYLFTVAFSDQSIKQFNQVFKTDDVPSQGILFDLFIGSYFDPQQNKNLNIR
jgi:hypothetical protein